MFGWRARIGHISPAPAEAECRDFYQFAPQGVSLVITALSVQEISTQNLERAVTQAAANSISDLAVEQVDCIVLAGEPMVFLYGYGSEERLNKIAGEITSIPFTHNLPCAVEALRYLKVKKLALATPYSVKNDDGDDIAYQKWKEYFLEAEFDLVGFATLSKPTNRDVAVLPDYSPYQLAKRAINEARTAPDCVYLPCARWSGPSNINRIEEDFGIPVVTSVQAWTWKALQIVGIHEIKPGSGSLFHDWALS
jgi:maleate cis-trans isomerase